MAVHENHQSLGHHPDVISHVFHTLSYFGLAAVAYLSVAPTDQTELLLNLYQEIRINSLFFFFLVAFFLRKKLWTGNYSPVYDESLPVTSGSACEDKGPRGLYSTLF